MQYRTTHSGEEAVDEVVGGDEEDGADGDLHLRRKRQQRPRDDHENEEGDGEEQLVAEHGAPRRLARPRHTRLLQQHVVLHFGNCN